MMKFYAKGKIFAGVTYKRTLFKTSKTGASCYLLDKLLKIDLHTRMSEDAVARILEETVDSTYRKGGANASISGSIVSKETVMNKLHALEFPQTLHQGEKKAVETARGYIVSNWSGIQISMKGKDKSIQCSAEGHVSHVFSDRMSSRPLG